MNNLKAVVQIPVAGCLKFPEKIHLDLLWLSTRVDKINKLMSCIIRGYQFLIVYYKDTGMVSIFKIFPSDDTKKNRKMRGFDCGA